MQRLLYFGHLSSLLPNTLKGIGMLYFSSSNFNLKKRTSIHCCKYQCLLCVKNSEMQHIQR